MHTKIRKAILLATGLILLNFSLGGQNKQMKKSIFDALLYQDPVEVSIKTDLDSLINIRNRETYQPAEFIFVNKNKKRIKRKIRLKPRGKYRRRVCDFPSIKIDFSKKDLKESGLARYDDYKLVTHCLEDKNISRENVMREYLIYKLYNILTEKSFRVQSLNINYIDSKDNIKPFTRKGFIIENEGEIEDRLAIEIFEDVRLPADSLNIEQLNFTALFQYMIGNLDWKASPFTQNVKVFKTEHSTKYELIPYDFDFSGLVGTSYQRLAVHLGQTNSRQRIFLGDWSKKEALKKAITHFTSRKKDLIDCIHNFKGLSKASRRDIRTYIETFFAELNDGSFLAKASNTQE